MRPCWLSMYIHEEEKKVGTVTIVVSAKESDRLFEEIYCLLARKGVNINNFPLACRLLDLPVID